MTEEKTAALNGCWKHLQRRESNTRGTSAWSTDRDAHWKPERVRPPVQTQEQRAQWLAARNTGSTKKVEMMLEGETVSVQPLWIAVHQSLEGGLARCAELKLTC